MKGFHWKDGWHFERIENGDVVIKKDQEGMEFKLVIDANSWCSIVASVSDSGTFYKVKEIHDKKEE